MQGVGNHCKIYFNYLSIKNLLKLSKKLTLIITFQVIQKVSHTLYNLQHIIDRNGGTAPLTYHQFLAIIATMGPPPQPELPVNQSILKGAITPLSDDHDEKYGVPTLEELGFDTEGDTFYIMKKNLFVDRDNFFHLPYRFNKSLIIVRNDVNIKYSF